MKVLLSLVLLFFCFSCSNEDSTKGTGNTQQSTSSNKPHSSDYHEDQSSVKQDKVIESEFDTIKAPKSGIVDWISGSGKIRKGRTLFSYDNYERFDNLSKKKMIFRLTVDSLLDNAGSELDVVSKKWHSFRNSLRTDTLLPQFPKIEFREEGMHYGKQSLAKAYNEIVELENNMKADFVSAKQGYKKIKWKVKKGQQVKRGQVVAIAQK